MAVYIPDFSSKEFRMAIRMPSSFDHLPPPRLPAIDTVREVGELRRSIVEQSGLKPGIYDSLDDKVYERVELIYNRILQHLIDEIALLCLAIDTKKSGTHGQSD